MIFIPFVATSLCSSLSLRSRLTTTPLLRRSSVSSTPTPTFLQVALIMHRATPQPFLQWTCKRRKPGRTGYRGWSTTLEVWWPYRKRMAQMVQRLPGMYIMVTLVAVSGIMALNWLVVRLSLSTGLGLAGISMLPQSTLGPSLMFLAWLVSPSGLIGAIWMCLSFMPLMVVPLPAAARCLLLPRTSRIGKVP